RRPLYAGYIHLPDWGFHMHPGKHEPLVSLTLWQQVQDKLNTKKKRSQRADLHADFPLRNFVACEECGSAMTAGWSRSKTGRHYGYYTCQAKGCGYRGKSIRKEKIEDAFSTLIRTIAPAPQLLRAATAMFRDLWDGKLRQLESERADLKAQAEDIERKLGRLITRLVEASSETVVKAYEEEIGRLEHQKRLLHDRQRNALEPLRSFDESFSAAIQFLAKPWILWENGTFDHKRLLLRLAVPEPITYARIQGFLNPELSLPFKVLGGAEMQNLNMVR
ncbi:MAG: zinc ribbon domain-containing protein, partial [Pseudomonadota bacterium]